jgi:ketosteroid isomerase-like protein
VKTHVSSVACFVLVSAAGLLASPAQNPDPAAGRAALMAADRAFAAATAANRVEGWVQAWADSGFQLVPNQPVRKGRAAIRERMTPFFADTSVRLTWEPDFAEVAASGELGFTVGHSTTRRIGPDGKPIVRTGKYFTTWQKDRAGTWKVLADVGTQDN